MKEIILNNCSQTLLVDDEDLQNVSQFNWCAVYSKTHKRFREIRTSFSYTSSKNVHKCKSISIHIFVLGLYKFDGQQIQDKPWSIVNTCKSPIDHKDHSIFNNQKYNLRICTDNQNKWNRGAQRNNTSGYKGVSKCGNKWVAGIWKDNKKYHLGTFTNIIDAAIAYDLKALELHGEFACTNFPLENYVKKT
jgi:hypothetical protein